MLTVKMTHGYVRGIVQMCAPVVCRRSVRGLSEPAFAFSLTCAVDAAYTRKSGSAHFLRPSAGRTHAEYEDRRDHGAVGILYRYR